MLPTFVIGRREGLEAALIVGIIAAFLGQEGEQHGPQVGSAPPDNVPGHRAGRYHIGLAVIAAGCGSSSGSSASAKPAAVAPFSGTDPGLHAETFWSALHGICALYRNQRLDPRRQDERLGLIFSLFTAIDRPPH